MPQVAAKKTPGILGSFMDGAKNGWNIAISAMLPGVMFAFVLMQVLNITGLAKPIETVFAPVMGLFGVPGMAVAAIMFAFLSTSGGFGVAVGLYTAGSLNNDHMAILTAGIMCAGAMMQYMGRVLGTAEVEGRFYPVMIVIVIFNTFLSMLIMRFLV